MRLALLIVLLVVGTAMPVVAADVLLDKPVRVGDLVMFPSRADETKYFYAPLKARLAVHESGAPQFSFLRWVQNVRSEAGAADVREGEGGGLLHAVVVLGITEEELEDARSGLESLKSGATIEGPILYDRGEFALITSFQNDEGELTRSLVGVGDAPILDGGKAAVSMLLTRLGSQILWESFNTPTPDISFLFKMEMQGFRSPKQAILTANFDEMYEHESFNEKFELGGSLDVGAAVPVDKIAAAMGVTGLPEINVGAAAHIGGVMQSEVDEVFEELLQEGVIEIEFVGEDEQLRKIVDDAFATLRDVIFQPAKKIARPDEKGGLAGLGARGVESRQAAPATGAQQPATQQSAPAGGGQAQAQPTQQQAPQQKPANTNQQAQQPAPASKGTGCSGFPSSDAPGGGGGGAAIELKLAIDVCLTTKYELKKKHHKGTYRLDMRKFTASKVVLPFVENVGDLRKHLGNPAIFRRVNLDDPLYKQREIAAAINGLQVGDFETYLNSVAVQLRKQHEQGGEPTFDEVRIDRSTFNRTGNDFKLMYGWKGDDDRDAWLDYEYRAQWSFAGGNQQVTEWTPASFSVIPLDAPFERREIRLEGSPEFLAEAPAAVRSITVKIHYGSEGAERTEQVTLRADKGDLSRIIEVVMPAGQLEYAYEISWRMRGNKTVTTGRLTTTEDVLYVDELPEA